MAREWNDLNDANLPASVYEPDGIDRLFHPDPVPTLSAFGSLEDDPFGAGAAESRLSGVAPDAVLPPTADMAPGRHAAEDLAVPHDSETDLAGPSDRTVGAETAMFRGSFATMWIVVPPTWLSGKWRSIGPLSAPAGGHNSFFRCLPCQ